MRHRLPQPRQLGLLLLLTLAVAAAVLLAMEQVGLPLTGIDDAHIFFVYGQNLASGEGLVYNPGGEPVEGFSSLLWLLLVTLGYLLFPRPEPFLLVASVAMIAAAIAVLVWHVNNKRAIGLGGLIVIAWALSSPAYITWLSLALMDTVLWSALLILGVVFALEGRIIPLAVTAIAMVLARPEGMLWAPALIVIAALLIWVERGPKAAARQVRSAVLAYLVTLTLLTLWRLWTFGYPLPNTYYAKMSPDTLYNLGQGINYLIAFLYMNPIVLIGVVPAITALLLNGRWFISAVIRPETASGDDPRLRYIAVSAIVLLALLVPVYMGGDHFGNFRFYQPAWPLFILPALALIRVLKIQAPRTLGAIVALALILAAFLLPRANWFNQAYADSLAHEISIAREGRALGRSMNALFGDDPVSSGVIRAGAVAATYEGEVVDLMGLNNTAMAHALGDRTGLKNHAAFNADVFFSQWPEIVLPMLVSRNSVAGDVKDRLAWDNAVLKGLLADARFSGGYELVTISDGRITILTFVRDTTLFRLKNLGLEIKPAKDRYLPRLTL